MRDYLFCYLKEINFRVDFFSRVIFFNISCGFNFGNWPPFDFSWGFIVVYLSFIIVLYILIFSWFGFQLAVCESWNSYPNILIFLIALFGYKRVNSPLNAQEEIKRSKFNKKIYIFLSVLILLILFDILHCKIFFAWPSLIDIEHM